MSRSLRARQLAAIHIRAKERGLDEEAYRDMLREVAGVSSARDLDARGREAVLQRLGKRPAARRWAKRNADPMVRKIYALLGDRPPSYAVGIMRQAFGADAPDAIEWATGDQLKMCMQALIYDRQRRQAQA